MQQAAQRPAGMRAFIVVWLGQLGSLMGTGMTQFAITLWAWEQTGQATALTLVAFFTYAPTVLMSPIAGALVDRWNRKLVMMLSDVGTSIATVSILLLTLTDSLQIWHLYVAGAFAGVFQSFQFPAYSAAISVMVSKKQYARTSAMISLAESSSIIVAPLAAAALYAIIGLQGILVIDCLTFLLAFGTLLVVFIPQPKRSAEGAEGKGNLWIESLYGFRYILKRPSLLSLQMLFLFGNLIAGLCMVLTAPMILARTGNDELILASVVTSMGIGGVAGGLIMSAWGGPKRRIHGVLLGWMLSGLAGMVVLGLGQIQPVWMAGGFLLSFCIAPVNASNQAIWQSKVAPDVQGRVFAVRRVIAQVAGPLAMFIAGPLADFVFEPALMPGGLLAASVGQIVGTGPGAGMSAMFLGGGLLIGLLALTGYLIPMIRNVEDIIPDHQEAEVVPGADIAAAPAGVSSSS
jgi:MFS transporter, DHA3 family, macrolide efflux protein